MAKITNELEAEAKIHASRHCSRGEFREIMKGVGEGIGGFSHERKESPKGE